MNVKEQKQTIKNAQRLAQSLYDVGFKVFGEKLGFTKSHQILVEIGPGKGKEASKKLEDAGIDNPIIAPVLLPDYSTEEVSARRWLDTLMENE